MIDKETAKFLALQALQEIDTPEQRAKIDDLVLVESATIEESFGWVFFFTSAMLLVQKNKKRRFGFLSFLFSKDEEFETIFGNGPIIVDRCDGSVHRFGTTHPPEYYIEVYNRQRTVSC